MEQGRFAGNERKPQLFYENYEEFYEAYYQIVLGYLRKKVNSFADAEDIAGKVFLYCFEKWDTYDPMKASQATWLFMIVRCKWMDFLRSNRSFVDIDELDEKLAGGANQIENAVKIEAVRQELVIALEKLAEKQREAIIMRYFGDYGDEEIAEHLKTTTGNVRVLIHRGLSRLKSEFAFKELCRS